MNISQTNPVTLRISNRDTKFHPASLAIGGAAGNATADVIGFHRCFPKHHIRVRAFAVFGDEAVD
jgi:hypothetical protein